MPLPPLPGEEGPVSPAEAFSILPGSAPAESLTPDNSPVEPPPDLPSMDELPDIEAPGLPADGEQMPAAPSIPGLKLPVHRPASSLPPLPETPAELPLPPGIELAKKAYWHHNPHDAYREAVKSHRPILIFFAQMPDAECLSAQLNDDLLSLPEFNEFAAAKLVLTMLQYPVGSPGRDYPEAKLAALKELQTKFKVRGFPCVVVIDETGREIERIRGYGRVKLAPGSDTLYSTAHVLLDRLKEAVHRHEERRRYREERLANLEAQGYRLWTSQTGSTLMGKLVDARPERIVLMDENGQWRTVHPMQLRLYDAEWARRKQAGLLPAAPPKRDTAASVP
jgi:hypothetical protein